MKTALLLLCLSGCCSCASNDAWTQTDTSMEIAFQLINAVDGYSTMQIRHVDSIEERAWPTKEFIGRNPTERDVALLFAVYGVSHYFISRSLPERWRRYYQAGTLAFSLAFVVNNCRQGLCK